ncbi:hypothetical protein [Ammoniphilus sp. CFH 90114]|uniref:hypothetical protein n=1 Tax=Ammoniphilus sp. CFH 90114 TaxID=2493665 RepID=UPI00100F0EAE|nr:hypothetical protein [Ammoniphilus sp. CFH 90114]RXT15263.1 hypothetical protein EIZ39_03370 [Ammoniphilus sp. CFH 90114]
MKFLPEREQKLLSQYVYIPLVLHVFNRDRGLITDSLIKLKEPYLAIIEEASLRVEKDYGSIKKALRDRGVKIYSEKRTEEGVELRYFYQGYHHQAEYKWEFVRSEVLYWMHWYLKRTPLPLPAR